MISSKINNSIERIKAKEFSEDETGQINIASSHLIAFIKHFEYIDGFNFAIQSNDQLNLAIKEMINLFESSTQKDYSLQNVVKNLIQLKDYSDKLFNMKEKFN